MPVYLDHHAPPKGITPEQVKMMQEAIKAGQRDANGVKGLNGFWTDTEAWCLVEAPNPQLVHKLHEEMYNIKLGPGDVKQVQALVS